MYTGFQAIIKIYKHSLGDNIILNSEKCRLCTYEITAVNRVREEDSDPNLLKHISDVTIQINFTTITVAFTFIYRSVKISDVFVMITV